MDILIMRHAEAEEPPFGMSDEKRDLTQGGVAEATAAGRALARLRLVPDAILSSPAVRACRTASIVAEELGVVDRLRVEARMGLGAQPEHLSTILRANSSCRLLMLVGHQPTVSRMIAQMTGGGDVEMPTAAFALLRSVSPGCLGSLRLLAPPQVAKAIAKG